MHVMKDGVDEWMNEWSKFVTKNTILKLYWMDQIVSREEKQKKKGYCCTLAWQHILKMNVTLLLNVSSFPPNKGIKKAWGI